MHCQHLHQHVCKRHVHHTPLDAVTAFAQLHGSGHRSALYYLNLVAPTINPIQCVTDEGFSMFRV